MNTKRATSARAVRQAMRQRDALLNELESLVRLGYLGEVPWCIYIELHIEHLRKAERVARRIRRQLPSA